MVIASFLLESLQYFAADCVFHAIILSGFASYLVWDSSIFAFVSSEGTDLSVK